jgi:pimeloyl-ACP methyl ester carboxylesterase
MTAEYRTSTVPVNGGDLTVGVWGPDNAPTVLAIHGITASHVSWKTLAETAPDLRIIAPDLRGRGRSNRLPGPWGMGTHAADMVALLDAFGVEQAIVVGHSMGAFVSATLARTAPARVAELVLIDGGLPIPHPAGVAAEDLPKALIGPAAERLSMTFESAQAYRDFWRKHPAFAGDWTPAVEAYVDYDLDGTAPQLSPSSRYEAVAADSLQLSGDVGYADALAALPMPVSFLRAPRGLMNEPRALYSPSTVEEWEARMPRLTTHEIADVNHYTIVMARRGADDVAAIIRSAVARTANDSSRSAAS